MVPEAHTALNSKLLMTCYWFNMVSVCVRFFLEDAREVVHQRKPSLTHTESEPCNPLFKKKKKKASWEVS